MIGAWLGRWSGRLSVIALGVAAASLMLGAQNLAPLAGAPGGLSDGTTLLSNGWRLQPAGKHLTVGDMPLNLLQSPDGKYLIVTNNGYAAPSFSVIDVASWSVKSTFALDHAWLGLVWHPDGTKFYSSGANLNNIQEFTFADGVITRGRSLGLPAAAAKTDTFTGGISISPDGKTLFATRIFSMTLSAIDVATGAVTQTVSLPSEPYTTVVSPDGTVVYVSLWGGAKVQVYDARTLRFITDLATGEHPTAMAITADGRRLFVACGSDASVWVFNTFSWESMEQISISLFPDAPPTATPNALSIGPDGQTLLVANADDNAVAMVDISNVSRSFVAGFVPTGWYPTGAAFSRDGKQIFVLSGRGMTPSAKPTDVAIEKRLLGTVSAVATPDRTALAEYTRRVYTVTPYSDSTRLAPANAPVGSPVPRAVGAASPIKHVFYIIRENRTYDSVLGDVATGNGDPKLVLFGRETTPNAHALAESFVLFDNFYVDAEVSYSGHAYSTAAYSTDFVEKLWQTNYAGRGGPYLGEGGGSLRCLFGNITAPPRGYLWDHARRAGVSFRSYGEFVNNLTKSSAGEVTTAAAVPGLSGAIAPTFAGYDLDIQDSKRTDIWQAEFNDYVRNNNLPQLQIIRLANDHTNGTKAGSPTPRAMMADNDLALGRIVEAISNSPYWQDSAVFVLEDDAQSGPDHVDSHRSILLLASPFAKRAAADHTFYTTSGVLRTIELILGLPPMSQYDAAATPMYNAFQATPNLAPFKRLSPQIPLDERNLASAFGAKESLAMDFSEADRTPEQLLNEILWRSVKGAKSPMPPPRRSVFHRPSSANTADDDDDE